MNILRHGSFLVVFLSLSMAQNQVMPNDIYQKAWQTAMEDGIISSDEQKLLSTLSTALNLSPDSTAGLSDSTSKEGGMIKDQSGRWPLVLQNMVIGSGLYGWTVPYVLGADDFRWYAGTEMLSLGGAFYLTYKYTEDMDISHARAQMLRYGGLVGLRYGLGTKTLFRLSDTGKTWAWILMASVPTGIIAGDYFYSDLKPSNGQAWVFTLWTALGGINARTLYTYFDPDPYYGNEENEVIDPVLEQQLEKDYETWNRNHTAIELLVGYPIGFLVGKKLAREKTYSFGDALMLYQGYGFGFFNSMMLQEILYNKFDEKRWMVLNNLGALGSMLYYDKWIGGFEFSAGQSILMSLGSASGMAFGTGLGIIMEVDNLKSMMILTLTGYGLGTYLTRGIVHPNKEGSTITDLGAQTIVMPTVLSYTVDGKRKTAPAISINFRF